MRALILTLFVLISQFVVAQHVSHRMTEAERALMPAYLESIEASRSGDPNPPPTPVRVPGEWEEAQGIMITWTQFPAILAQIVDHAQEELTVYIVTQDSNSVKTYLGGAGVPTTNVVFLTAPFNTIWIRDYGPWSAYTTGSDSLKLIDWIYNRPRPKDDTIPRVMASHLGLPLHETINSPNNFVATGGNFMTDGFGTAFSSRLIIDENPGKSEEDIDSIVYKYMGIDTYIKMTNLPYDGIHHIDMHMKLLDEETILIGEYPEFIADGPQIEANINFIQDNFTSVYGTPYKIVRIQMPPENGNYPHQGGDYRTYTNGIFVNNTYLYPTYEEEFDSTAQALYERLLPGYKVIGINSNAIIPLGGAIHCITKLVHSDNPMILRHQAITDTVAPTDVLNATAFIQHSSGISSATLYHRTDTTQPYQSLTMSDAGSDNWTTTIPTPAAPAEVHYYIEGNATSGKQQVRPLPAPEGYWKFHVINPVGVAPKPKLQFAMEPAFPNPSKGMTCIPVSSAGSQAASIRLLDVLGRTVTTIYDGQIPAGKSRYYLNSTYMNSGAYLIVIESSEGIVHQKLIIR